MDPVRKSTDTSPAGTGRSPARTGPPPAGVRPSPAGTGPPSAGTGRSAGTGPSPGDTAPAPDRTGQTRRARRRERLLTTATELFITRGYPATSIERICVTARVSIRAFYEEFEGREALLIALHNDVARSGMEAALTVLSDPATESADTRDRITALTRAYVDAVTADPAATRIAFIEVIGAGRAVEDHRLLWRGLWTDFLTGEAARAVERGEAVRRDYALAMVALIGAVNELVGHWARNTSAFSPLMLADELVHHALAVLGLSVGPGGPGGSGVPMDGVARVDGARGGLVDEGE
ncbi:TetR family transcriptional regulator [Streptomyces scopuliridis]|uniref:TetR family transcriptional regulator n=1 Tax=Streptomyces scopuliridis TaxID=452529 RepID=A0ACD4ZD22_9ACTN|nr:TetR family transcriptional regulator [Streptomyces scopuliridis]WSB32077.1 TetR family transcriptional regulator [Streptomyces scopuliridis]WSB96339.1 TetR family transcriptional regulator [Streptomyces scopuliridis]WSC09956.1 TetR family transcriptional regulator [Streptomyces scopuliridis]